MKKKLRKARMPKLPPERKPAVASTKDLRLLYESMITADEGQFLAALVSAVHWYRAAIRWWLRKCESEHLEMPQNVSAGISKFHGHAARGAQAETNEQKIGWYVDGLQFADHALRQFLRHLPSLRQALDARAAQQERLFNLEEKLRQKWDYILTVLQEALRPTNDEGQPIALKVGKIKDPMIMDPELRTLSFRKDQVKEMNRLMRQEGIWAVVLEVSEPLSRMAAMKQDRDRDGKLTGKRHVDAQLQVARLMALWQTFKKWAQQPGAPKRVLKAYAPPPKGEKKKLAPGMGFHGMRKDRNGLVLGRYEPASAIGRLAGRIKDGQFHGEEELQKLIWPIKLQTRLPVLAKHGEETQRWMIERVGGEVRMVMVE